MALTKITKTGITADAIDATKIADDAVESAQIKADAVTTAKLAADAVTTVKINADAVDATKIADNSISEEHLDTTVFTGNAELAEGANASDILLIYDASAGTIKKILASNVGTQVVTLTSVSPTNALGGDGTGNHTFTITGSNLTGASAELINNSGTIVNFDSVTVNSATQITGVIAKSSLPTVGEPYDIRVLGSNGAQATLRNQINVDASPIFVTASGSLGSQLTGQAGSFTVNATDPDSAGNVTFELQSGSLPPGYTLTNTAAEGGTAIIAGTDSTTSSTTTFNFVLRAVDAASNTSSRAYSITQRVISYQTFTASGTFAVPAGLTSITEVLVVAGGGGGGNSHSNPQGQQGGGGGGAGGLVFMPTYPVTPSGTITVTVGNGSAAEVRGVDSAFGSPGDPGLGQGGVLTAKGGGGGAGTFTDGQPGGSGGGAAGPGTSGGTRQQHTQPGNSGAYGFGNNGGPGVGRSNGSRGAGGGGASATGACGGGNPGAGGYGKYYTIADGTTPVGYAGGGGGGGGAPQETGAAAGATQFGGADGAGGGSGGVNAAANRGGGAGGGDHGGTPTGGTGGKGIVIIKY